MVDTEPGAGLEQVDDILRSYSQSLNHPNAGATAGGPGHDPVTASDLARVLDPSGRPLTKEDQIVFDWLAGALANPNDVARLRQARKQIEETKGSLKAVVEQAPAKGASDAEIARNITNERRLNAYSAAAELTRNAEMAHGTALQKAADALSQRFSHAADYLAQNKLDPVDNLRDRLTEFYKANKDFSAEALPSLEDSQLAMVDRLRLALRMSCHPNESLTALWEVREELRAAAVKDPALAPAAAVADTASAVFHEFTSYIAAQEVSKQTPIEYNKGAHVKWPVAGVVTSTLGDLRRDAKTGKEWLHQGVDVSAPIGTPVRATGDGVVTFAGVQHGYGKLIVIDHPNGSTTKYAHLDKIDVALGQKVDRGQRIAESGNTGIGTGPHVHYEELWEGRAHPPTGVPVNYTPKLAELRDPLGATPTAEEAVARLVTMIEAQHLNPAKLYEAMLDIWTKAGGEGPIPGGR
jgi:murein DD-endopeptidase MepM/ murein hydrolase activator NlpD